MHKNIVSMLQDNFINVFNVKDQHLFFSPGRVNLIGEHTDYNGGHVFPCALSFGTYGIISKRNDRKVRLYSMNFEDLGVIEFSLDYMVYDKAVSYTHLYKIIIIKYFIH